MYTNWLLYSLTDQTRPIQRPAKHWLTNWLSKFTDLWILYNMWEQKKLFTQQVLRITRLFVVSDGVWWQERSSSQSDWKKTISLPSDWRMIALFQFSVSRTLSAPYAEDIISTCDWQEHNLTNNTNDKLWSNKCLSNQLFNNIKWCRYWRRSI